MLDFYFFLNAQAQAPPLLQSAGGCYGVAIHSKKTTPPYRVRGAGGFKGHSHKSRSPPSLLFALSLRCAGHRRAPAPFLPGVPFALSFWQCNRAVSFTRDGDPRLILSKPPTRVPVPLLPRALLAEGAGPIMGRVGCWCPRAGVPMSRAEGSRARYGRCGANCFTPRGKPTSPAFPAAP